MSQKYHISPIKATTKKAKAIFSHRFLLFALYIFTVLLHSIFFLRMHDRRFFFDGQVGVLTLVLHSPGPFPRESDSNDLEH